MLAPKEHERIRYLYCSQTLTSQDKLFHAYFPIHVNFRQGLQEFNKLGC